jgi:hypothetical protein
MRPFLVSDVCGFQRAEKTTLWASTDRTAPWSGPRYQHFSAWRGPYNSSTAPECDRAKMQVFRRPVGSHAQNESARRRKTQATPASTLRPVVVLVGMRFRSQKRPALGVRDRHVM